MISVTGYDSNGISRVYGRHEVSADIADTRARDVATDYLRRRPDTGPLDKWRFERDVCDRQLFQSAK